MGSRGLIGMVCAALLTGCAAQQGVQQQAAQQGDPNYFKVRDSMADEVYVTDDISRRGWFDDVRRIYIAPTNTSQMQIIQPYGVRQGSVGAWDIDDVEQGVLQNTFIREMTRAMEADQAFHIVPTREEAHAVLYSRLIAVHPYQTRTEVEAGARAGGALTMSFALVDPSDGEVVIKAIDSKSTDDIWAFDNIEDDRNAVDLIFDAWGHQIRRSLLFMQGRLDSVPTPILLKRQQPKKNLL